MGTSGTGFYSVPALIIGSPWTMSLWVKVTVSGVAENIDPLSSNNGGFWLNIARGYPYGVIFSFGGGIGPKIDSVMYQNIWYFISIVFNGTTSTMYINGVASPAYSTTAQLTSAVNIGTYSTDNVNGSYGAGSLIYDARMFNTVLSSTQINTLMTTTKRVGT